MNKSKRKRLEAKGWKVGSTEEFLSTYDREMQDPEFRSAFNRTRIPRKLKKKYKRMGIWKSYITVDKRTVEQRMRYILGLRDSSATLD